MSTLQITEREKVDIGTLEVLDHFSNYKEIDGISEEERSTFLAEQVLLYEKLEAIQNKVQLIINACQRLPLQTNYAQDKESLRQFFWHQLNTFFFREDSINDFLKAKLIYNYNSKIAELMSEGQWEELLVIAKIHERLIPVAERHPYHRIAT